MFWVSNLPLRFFFVHLHCLPSLQKCLVVFALFMIILPPGKNCTPVLLSVFSLPTHPPKRGISVIILLHVSGTSLWMLRFMKPTLIFVASVSTVTSSGGERSSEEEMSVAIVPFTVITVEEREREWQGKMRKGERN